MKLRRIAILPALLFAVLLLNMLSARVPSGDQIHVFENVEGPAAVTAVSEISATPWQRYGEGGHSRMAILLTDPDSAWLGLAHGLESIGLPFRFTDDPLVAVEHRVVMVYPMLAGSVISPEGLRSLSGFVRDGGTLIGVNVLGGGLQSLFGFTQVAARRDHSLVRFDVTDPVAQEFSDPREREIRIANVSRSHTELGTHDYLEPRETPLAVYEDGTAAILRRSFESGGHAYAFGFDPGLLFLKAYNRRLEGVSDSYANGFEPTVDVLLRLLRAIYRKGEQHAVTLATVPQGRALALILTHDIDYSRSMIHAAAYAEHEQRIGVSGTHFIQTKYVRDWNDEIFLDDEYLPHLRRLVSLGAEIASHSVSHSRVFSRFPLGTGDERYPAYRPFVKSRLRTWGGTILGELRVSRFLLEELNEDVQVVSFRPGHLENPSTLPQALEAAGYRFSSSVTANVSMSHLPFRLNHDRGNVAEGKVFEFPITVEDEMGAPPIERLEEAIELGHRIGRYGGLFVVLIHPDRVGTKLEFQQRLVEALGPTSWMGSLAEFGSWWAARAAIQLDVHHTADGTFIELQSPERIEGLALDLPDGFYLAGAPPVRTQRRAARIVLDAVQGRVTIPLLAAP